jgi:hypothetical protein
MLDKIFLIVLGGSFIGAIFVAVLVFFLTSELYKSLIALIGSQILFLIPVFGIRKIIDDTIIKKLGGLYLKLCRKLVWEILIMR